MTVSNKNEFLMGKVHIDSDNGMCANITKESFQTKNILYLLCQLCVIRSF